MLELFLHVSLNGVAKEVAFPILVRLFQNYSYHVEAKWKKINLS